MDVPRQREWVIVQVYYSHYIFTKEREDIVLLPSHASNRDGEYPHAHLLYSTHCSTVCVRFICVCGCVFVRLGVFRIGSGVMGARNIPVEV